MNLVGKNGFVALFLLVLVSGCSTPGYVRVDLVELDVVAKSKTEFETRFVTVPAYAAIVIDDGTNAENLTDLTGNTVKKAISKPVASPTQDAFVFYEFAGQTSTIYRQSLGSQARSPITSSDSLDLTPAFTPNGDYLVFSSDRTGDGQGLWRVRSDGAGGITQITSSASSFDVEPSVAADGETIVFQSYRANDMVPSIWSVSMNGGLLTLLGKGESPRVSPDGRRIVFVRPQQGVRNKQLWVMNIDGSGQTQLTNNQADDMDPSWHPNGRVVVFASNSAKKESGKSDFDVWMMRADGTDRVQLTDNPSHDDGPMFERKGRDIIFRSNRGGAWNLFSFQPKLK
jgi:Tol biopolymer transport system component